MPPNQYSQNNNNPYSQYTSGGYEKIKLRKLLLPLGLLVAICITIFIIHLTRPESQQAKYIKSATLAARKQTPNAKVSNLRVAGGFALSTVKDPTATGQANAGFTTVFKVNGDGSMKQIASGSYISPLTLLGLGIPLSTQAKLTVSSLAQIKQTLADQCGYEGGDTPGYSGFDGSFSPGDFQVDSGTLSGIEQAVSSTLSNQDTGANVVICVNATQKNSNATTDKNTYISTFTLQVQFITGDGVITNHTVTFAIGPNYYHNYTLDGKDISNTSSTAGQSQTADPNSPDE